MAWQESEKNREGKAKRHYEVSTKKTYQTTLRSPILSAEEADFMSNPSKYINELSPLYNKALQSSTKDKWTARTDYIKLLIKKALEHSIKDKEGQHFIMYLHEIKEDLKTQEPEKSQDDFLNEKYIIQVVPYLSVGDIVQRVRDSQKFKVEAISKENVYLKDITLTIGSNSKPKPIEIKNGMLGGYTLIEKYVSPIDIEIQKVQKIIDNFKTRDDYNNAMHILGQIAVNHHPSISQQEKMREMAKILSKKSNELLEKDNEVYNRLKVYINAAETSQKLDDLHADANRVHIKGQITDEQLQEIYMLINDRDEKVRVAQKEKLKNLQSQYQVGDFLERLPDIESVIKPGIYTITQIIPHKEMTFGNASPTDVRVVNEYRVAKVNPDGTLNQIGGMVLTATIMSNTFKKTTPDKQSELNKATIEQTKSILIEGINKISTIKGLDEFDIRLKEHLIANGITSVQDPRIIDVIVALNKRRRDLTGSMAKGRLDDKIIKQATDWEISNLQYEATHKPPEMLPPQEISDVTKYVWGVSEQEAIKKYVDKELKKYQYNVDFTNKQKADIDAIEKSKPWVLLTKAQILRDYPEKAEEYTRDLWTYKSKKSDWEKNFESSKYWREKVNKITSGEWEKINNNYLRDQYKKEVTKAIRSGRPVPYDVVKQFSEFSKAQSKHDIYKKGLHTSFGNESIAVDRTHKENSGVKIKIQSGRPMDEKTADEILLSLSQYQSAVGNITDIMKREDITISHTDHKHPYLSKVAGMYHPTQKTLSVGYAGWKAMSHELTHMVDETAKDRHKDQPLYDYSLLAYAKRNLNGGVERAISLSKSKSPEELEESRNLRFHISTYWARPEELWARLVEQYSAWKNQMVADVGISNESYKRYTKTPAYWSDDVFMTMKNQIEIELERKIRLARN